MNPAPPKPPSKNADRKAMTAYWSELRRWAEALANWEADLDKREAELEVVASKARHFDDCFCDEGTCNIHPNQDYGEDGDTIEEDCYCTTEDAEDGCECPACENWRSQRAQEMIKRQQAAAKTGDEIQWLEALYKLPDKRRKK